MNYLFLFITLFSFISFAQEPGEQVYDFIEVEPQFPGGIAACIKWFNENHQYPTEEANQGIEGTVFL